jgi:hypothetical protein
VLWEERENLFYLANCAIADDIFLLVRLLSGLRHVSDRIGLYRAYLERDLTGNYWQISPTKGNRKAKSQ